MRASATSEGSNRGGSKCQGERRRNDPAQVRRKGKRRRARIADTQSQQTRGGGQNPKKRSERSEVGMRSRPAPERALRFLGFCPPTRGCRIGVAAFRALLPFPPHLSRFVSALLGSCVLPWGFPQRSQFASVPFLCLLPLGARRAATTSRTPRGINTITDRHARTGGTRD